MKILNKPKEDTNSMTAKEAAEKYLATGVVGELSQGVDDDESLKEDTVKTSDGKWTNKGKEGTHGKFKTKKQADAQRRAIWVNWDK